MNERDHDAMDRALEGMCYPCDRRQLVRHAAAQGAGDDLLGHLGGLPDHRYDGVTAVREALARRG